MMRALFQRGLWLLLLATSAALLPAQPAPGGPTAPARALPLPPLPPSPVDIFRTLLTNNAAGREKILSLKSPEQRRYLEAKIREYVEMTPALCETRLQTLQLRWYLPQLMRLNPAHQAQRLASIPQPDRKLLQERLSTWSILPPPLRAEVMDNEMIIRLFVRGESNGNTNALAALPPAKRQELEKEYERWQALPMDRRETIAARFQSFFEMNPKGRSNTLDRLTAAERAVMNQTLVSFEHLPREQRQQAMSGFQKFAELTPTERAAFLQSAERWRLMSEKDRDTWRKTVNQLQLAKIMPPPLPQPRRALSLVTTNY